MPREQNGSSSGRKTFRPLNTRHRLYTGLNKVPFLALVAIPEGMEAREAMIMAGGEENDGIGSGFFVSVIMVVTGSAASRSSSGIILKSMIGLTPAVVANGDGIPPSTIYTMLIEEEKGSKRETFLRAKNVMALLPGGPSRCHNIITRRTCEV